MMTWTLSARDCVERYLEDSRARLGPVGADVEEVVADLRRHIEAEASLRQLQVVTEEDARAILAMLGHPVAGATPSPPSPPSPPSRHVELRSNSESTDAALQTRRPRWMEMIGWGLLLFFGVLLPLGTLITEMVTHMCAEVLMDPLPDWIHVVAVAWVPLANLASWAVLRRVPFVLPRWLWLANGVAAGVALFYSILFLPFTPIAAIGVVFYGFGLLPLSPLLSMLATWRLRSHLKRRQTECVGHLTWGWGWAMGMPLLALCLVALPAPLTRYWVEHTGAGSEQESLSAIRRLRAFGSEEELLNLCYGRQDRFAIDLLGRSAPKPDQARQAYYRVYGRPFNASPPPFARFSRRLGMGDEFEWDSALGGDSVAGQLRGLRLTQSRMDGRCNAEDGWAYSEWILEFKNDHERSAREARAQIQLPPGGVVTRLTLWVNGEEREAAFGKREQVRQAYQQVAVVQRRDPVLVTTSGPDRVLLQCFPVPAAGGTMKIRLGITAPMALRNPASASLAWPLILERNFGLEGDVRHSLWMECVSPPREVPPGLLLEGHMLHGQVSATWLFGAAVPLEFVRSHGHSIVRARDRRSDGERWIEQSLQSSPETIPPRIAILLDGSVGMRSHLPAVIQALRRLPTGSDLKVWYASDSLVEFHPEAKDRQRAWVDSVSFPRAEGGQDNVPGLTAALGWASAKPGSVILWIHGPQRMLPSTIDSLLQASLWGQGPASPTLFDLPTEAAANRILEKLDAANVVCIPPDSRKVASRVEAVIQRWTAGEGQCRFVRGLASKTFSGSAEEVDVPASSHVVRLWAWAEVRRLLESKEPSKALELAMRYQLVTPVSGAVVLETASQYLSNGLTPVDPGSVPTVPEPSLWAMLGIGLGAIFLGHRAAKKRFL